MKIIKIGLLALLISLQSIYCDVSAVEDRKLKLSSCISLLRVAIREDKHYLEDNSKHLIDIKISTADVIFNKIKNSILLYCFTEVSLIKAAELTNAGLKRINPFTKENKSLINSENFKAKYGNNEKLLDKEMKVMEDIISSLMIEANLLYKEMSDDIKSFAYEKKEQKKKTEGEAEKLQSGFNLFGYDLTSSSTKYTLGLFVFALLLFCIYLAYNWINQKKYFDQKVSQKKKDKKKAE